MSVCAAPLAVKYCSHCLQGSLSKEQEEWYSHEDLHHAHFLERFNVIKAERHISYLMRDLSVYSIIRFFLVISQAP